MKKHFRKAVLLFVLGLSGLMWAAEKKSDWRTADRSSSHLTPLPKDEKQAIVQIYVARTYGSRGYLAVHPWIVIKEKDAQNYVSYEVMGFRAYRGENVVVSRTDEPDTKWFGSEPDLIYDLRGPAAENMIPHVLKAIESYQYPKSYRLWPGPNSNTFVSHVIRNTPGLYLELPPNAIGKDWVEDGDLFALSETKTGVQFSLFGLFGFVIGLGEGLEINILGMTFGIDLMRPALKMPFIGRIGMKDAPVFDITQDEKYTRPESDSKKL